VIDKGEEVMALFEDIGRLSRVSGRSLFFLITFHVSVQGLGSDTEVPTVLISILLKNHSVPSSER
jgi:hypothetical protein